MTAEGGFRRGDIWLVDFGQPVNHEQGMERPAVIVSKQELAGTAHIHGLLIAVPGTSTPQVNPKTSKIRISCVKAEPSACNGLTSPTYFMSEKVRSVSTVRFVRLLGRLESSHFKALEQCLCLVMDLFA